MAFDAQVWLQDVTNGAGLSDEQASVLTEVVGNEAVAKKLQESQMRLSDYSRGQDALRKQQEDLKAEYEQQFAALSQTEEQGVAAQKALEANLAQIQGERDQLDAAFRKAAGEYGFNADDLGTGTPNRQPAQPATSPGLTEEEVDKLVTKKLEAGLTEMARVYAMYPAELDALGADHRDLFGSDLDTRGLIREHLQTNTPLRDLWEQKHNVAGKRDEIATAELEQIKATAREEGVQEGIRKATIVPGSNDAPQRNLVHKLAHDLAQKNRGEEGEQVREVAPAQSAALKFRQRQLARQSPAA